MPERVAALGARDEERESARVPAVGYDDLVLARVPLPLERDPVAGVLACVEFHKHDWLLSGFGRLSCESWETALTAPTVRFLVRVRAGVLPWVRHGD